MAKSIIEETKKLYEAEKRTTEDNPTLTRLETTRRKLETLTERLSELPRGVSAEPIYTQMKKLDVEKVELEARVQAHQLKQAQPTMPAHLNSYSALLQGLQKIAVRAETAEAKAQVLKTLVHQVEVKGDGLRIHCHAGEQEIRRAKDGPRRDLYGVENFSSVDGSKSLFNGG